MFDPKDIGRGPEQLKKQIENNRKFEELIEALKDIDYADAEARVSAAINKIEEDFEELL